MIVIFPLQSHWGLDGLNKANVIKREEGRQDEMRTELSAR